jgi:hypothetical protein
MQQAQERNIQNTIEEDTQRYMDREMQREMDTKREKDMEREMDMQNDIDLHKDMAQDKNIFPLHPGMTEEDMTIPFQPNMTPNPPTRQPMPSQPSQPTPPTRPLPPMMPEPAQQEIIIGQRPYTGAENEYKDYDEFLNENPGRGLLEVQVFAASRAFPVRDARVVVMKDIGDRTYAFYDMRTDISGIASNMILPTKSRELSVRPDNVAPFTTYTVSVEHPDYVNTTLRNVTIFDGVKSILPVEMEAMTQGAGDPQAAVTYDELINTTGNRQKE